MAQIVLAEDDDDLRRVLERALTLAGHEVDALPDGTSALARLKQGSADLLLADVVMPGLDGLALAQQASRLHPGLKLMFITGFAAVAVDVRQRAPAGARLLSKPFHLRALVEEVEGLLAAN